MGTNYYLRYNICENCERYSELHIGKKSGGWEFSFHGYRDWVSIEDGSFSPIMSFQDWIKLLPSGRIFDEYGTEITLEVFTAMVLKSKGQMNHYDYCISEDYRSKTRLSQECQDLMMKDQWKDSDGWSFSDADFS